MVQVRSFWELDNEGRAEQFKVRCMTETITVIDCSRKGGAEEKMKLCTEYN